MALVIRMKNVSRTLLFLGSLMLWSILLAVANEPLFGNLSEWLVLSGAVLIATGQTWLLAYAWNM